MLPRFISPPGLTDPALATSSAGMSSAKTVASAGASGATSAEPISMRFCPGLMPSLVRSASSFMVPPLTPIIFCRSGGTPVSANSCALKSSTGAEVSSSTSGNFCLPHFTLTLSAIIPAVR